MPDKELGSVGSVSRGPTVEEERERLVPLIKTFRQEIDALIQRVPPHFSTSQKSELMFRGYGAPLAIEAYVQVRIHLTNAKMWAGKMLEGLGNPFPPELADKANVQ